MNTAIARQHAQPTASAIEQVLIKGDLSALTEDQRLAHYKNVCDSLGLNPLTQPFDYIKLNGKLVLYAKRDAAEQLRKIHGVSITEVTAVRVDDVYIVTAKAQDKTGRTDASTGAVTVGNLKGENLANALMKCETKAKRRVTLSICGLGMLDETEVDPGPVRTTVVDITTGEERQTTAAVPDNYDAWLADLEAVALEGADALREAWTSSGVLLRKHLTTTDAAKWDRIKGVAEKVKK
jgi:hypothetical protein